MPSLKLWRFDPITGYWKLEREVSPLTAHSWLLTFQKDKPTAIFKLAKRKPSEVP